MPIVGQLGAPTLVTAVLEFVVSLPVHHMLFLPTSFDNSTPQLVLE
jgi:hypothetical protein